MSVGTAGRADSETCCYFDPLCFWGPRPLPPTVYRTLCFRHQQIRPFILSSFAIFFRVKPSTVSTFRPPHRDSQTPSDSHLLHHQQRRGPGRVRTPEYQRHFNTLALSDKITEDLKACEGMSNSFFQDLFNAPLKGI